MLFYHKFRFHCLCRYLRLLELQLFNIDCLSHRILLFKALTQQWTAELPDPPSMLSQMSLNEIAVLSTLVSTSSNLVDNPFNFKTD